MKWKSGLIALLWMSCTQAPTPSTTKDSAADSKAEKKAAKNLQRPFVESGKIDDLTLRLNGFGVGIGDALSTKIPIISYVKPDLADYVQIIRCRSDARLSGLEDIDLSNPSSEYATQIFKTTHFWKLAGSNPFCSTIADSFGGLNFIDVFARGGDYVYLGRACVNKERIVSGSQEAIGECSKQVSISETLRGFKNKKFEAKMALEKREREIRDEGDTLARRIYFLTVKLSEALKSCEQAEINRQKRLMQENALTQILSIGVGIGATMFSPDSEVTKFIQNDTSGINGSNNSNPAQMGLVQGAIRTLFVSADDYPRSCTQAQLIKDEGEIAALKLQALQQQYASLLQDINVVAPTNPQGTSNTQGSTNSQTDPNSQSNVNP
jgi:hypothetical protein